jgi:hypothetical protein
MSAKKRGLTAGLFILLFSVTSLSQERGSITGIVTDPSGAAVPDAAVTATNTATSTTRTTQTTSVGAYTVPELPPGTYTVSVQKAGFKEAVVASVNVVVNTTTRIDVSLAMGTTTQTVEVTAAPALLQTDRTDTGATLTSHEILDLPIFIGGGLRSPLSFLTITPGVINSGGGDLGTRVAGGLSYEASQLLDGGELMSGRQNGPPINAVSVDAIQEYKVVTGSYSAEYGRTGNGVQNFVTKSGTNQLHASLFEYFRNNALNARGFYNATTPVLRQNDFGGSVGGPVYLPKVFDGRDKLFFFFAFEESKYTAGSPSGLTSVPPIAMRNGDFTGWVDSSGKQIPVYDPATTRIVNGQVVRDQISCKGVLNVICPDRIDPVAAKLMSLLPPPETTGLYNNIHQVGQTGQTQPVWSLRMDWNQSAKSRFSGMFSREYYMPPPAIGPIPGPLGNNFSTSGVSDYFRFSHDYTFTPTLLNHFVFGGNWTRYLEYSNLRGRTGSYALSAADKAAIQIKNVPVDPTAASEYVIGDGYPNMNMWVDTNSVDRTWNITDTLNLIHGRHSMKIGFEYLHTLFARKDCNQCAGEADFSDAITGLPGAPFQTGSGLASLLLGMPAYGAYNLGAYANWGAPYYAWFFQDDFKVTPRLTLNLGLRYDLPIPISERYGNTGIVCLTCPNPDANGIPGAIQFGGVGPGRTGRYRWTDTRTNAWGPRLGFAYQITPNTVFRAGGGIYYLAMREGANADRENNGFAGYRSVFQPNSYTPAFTLAQGVPTPIPSPIIDPGICSVNSSVGCTPFVQFPYTGFAPRLGSWNATVERRVGSSNLFRLAYAGSAGVHLFASRENIDQTFSQYMSLGSWLAQPVSSFMGTPEAQAIAFQLPFASFPTNLTVAQALKPFPQYFGISEDNDGDMSGHSTYHSMQLSFEHQTTHGLWMQASYTWSKLISNTEGGNPALGGFEGNGNIGTQNTYDRRADKAVSNSDIPHRLVISYVYDLPVGQGRHFLSHVNPWLNGLIGGWRVSGIQQYQSGVPIWVYSNQINGVSGTERANVNWGTPLINPAWNGDPNHAAYLNPAAFTRPPAFTFGNSPAAFTNLRNPGLLNEDLSLAKDFFLKSEQRKLTFQANFFNAFNRVVFGGPNNSLESAAFGSISSQANANREIQFMLRLQF